MTITIPIRAIEVTPGSMISIHNLSWQDFEEIIAELGEQRNTRIAYYRGTLEIMSPLAIHVSEACPKGIRPHRIIADIVKAILDFQQRDWDDFGSTTLKRPQIAGVEPDTCFYIQNASLVRGCTDMDLDIYPPPDLAIESDVTSKTTLDAYKALGVPEVWIYRNRNLRIYLLQNGEYLESSVGLVFPDLPIMEMIPKLVQKAIDDGSSRMLRELRIELG
ncbi:Uma2 family endonuclease [Limnofasciculus baicalensis]|uniref:Uma2 family endonuclease n=1 Tax=Limnofasciculus baicalensis BBK-W-15 TaxID=2699891 RepID=A0AAE3GST9_9CYAN|nr:Uma2 family endonuclease [Limnofasciculus baicalensis]MCP2730031.1 Uma2 family endonuclease [Limnofasciculus baicalensis BBK-W-15]